jgi:hypothetical protein
MINVKNNYSSYEIIGGKTLVKYTFFDIKAPLVITFAPARASVNSENIDNLTKVWGHDFVAKKSINVISFCCIDEDHWYRESTLACFIENMSSITNNFSSKVGYGVSMGAFGVSVFSNILGIDRLLLFSPISTLNPNKAGFEKRFTYPQKTLNWEGDYSDGSISDSKCLIVYDPLDSCDSKHAFRYKKPTKIKFFGVGHDAAFQSHKVNILGKLFLSVYNDGDVTWVYRSLRNKRRNIFKYYKTMLSDDNLYLTKGRGKILSIYFNMYRIKILGYSTIDPQQVDLIKNLAIKCEVYDLPTAHQLMMLAREYRPEGPTINNKIKQYERLLSKE